MDENINFCIQHLRDLNTSIQTSANIQTKAVQSLAAYVDQTIGMIIKALQESPSEVSSVQAKPEHSPRPAPNPRVMTDDERNALRELRKACVRKSSTGGQKEILMYLQAHGARSIWQLSPDFYDGLLKICGEE